MDDIIILNDWMINNKIKIIVSVAEIKKGWWTKSKFDNIFL